MGAVVISTYDDAHAAQVASALGHHKHVFVEKPMCRTLQELSAVRLAWWRHRGRIKLFKSGPAVGASLPVGPDKITDWIFRPSLFFRWGLPLRALFENNGRLARKGKKLFCPGRGGDSPH